MRSGHLIPHALLVALSLAAAACGDGNTTADRPVPRATAYPRPYAYDTAYTAVDGLPLSIPVNSAAVVTATPRPGGAWWLTVEYPRYKARIDYTLMPVDTATLEVNYYSRKDRILQNLGSATPRLTTIETPDGYTAQVLYAPEVLPTPVQFLAVDPDRPRWLVSGAAYFPALPAGASLDSLLPVDEALLRDIVRSLADMRDQSTQAPQ